MKRRGAWRTSVSLDKPRLSSPIFPSITHSHWTPSFTAHSPIHPTGWRGRCQTWHSLCTAFLLIFFSRHGLSVPFAPSTAFLCFRSTSSFYLLLSRLSFLNYLSPLFPFSPFYLLCLSPQQLLLCQIGAKFNTSVDGKEKAALCPSAPPLLSFKIRLENSQVAEEYLRLPLHVKNIKVVTVGENIRNITNCWKRYAQKCRQPTVGPTNTCKHIPFPQKWLTSPWQTARVITLWGDEKDPTLDQWHFCAFDLIIHIHSEEQPQAGATVKVLTFLSDKGTMISAWSQRWCHIFYSVWLDRVGQWKRNAEVGVWKSGLVWPVSLYSSSLSAKKNKNELYLK